MAILTIARLTIREASRRRLLLAIAILTLVGGVLSAWAFHRLLQLPCGYAGHLYPCPVSETRILAATLLILLSFMFSFILALGAAFMGAPAISTEAESGVLLSILPRPIRRSDVLIGKWLGLGSLITLYAALACGIEFTIVHFAMDYTPPNPFLAIAYVTAEALIVLTLALTFSTRVPAMTCGIVVLVLFGMMWMAGIAGAVGGAFHNSQIQGIGTISSLILPTDGLWRGAIYNLEPVALVVVQNSFGREASGNPFFVLSPPTTAYVLWCVVWCMGLLAVASWSFNRRDL